jgi:RNA polymerase sigma-70 factor (ECF subfamily)
MYRAAWALCGSREDAEDLVQDTFAQVLQRPRVVHGDERGYLLQALRNTFYMRLRTQSRRPRTTAVPAEFDPVDTRSPAPDRVAETGEVLGAIADLPEDFRLAIVAIDIVGLSYAEAAKALNTREATITSRLYRARQRIAVRFADRDDETGARSGPAVAGGRSPAAGAEIANGREGSGPARSPVQRSRP